MSEEIRDRNEIKEMEETVIPFWIYVYCTVLTFKKISGPYN